MTTQIGNRATTMPGRYYTDPKLFAEEFERFYFHDWICAGRADHIPNPGDYFLRALAEESIIVTRDQTGAVNSFYNVCRHRGTRICTETHGSFPGRIQCPYHAQDATKSFPALPVNV